MSKVVCMGAILFIVFCTIIGIEALKQITELEEDYREFEVKTSYARVKR